MLYCRIVQHKHEDLEGELVRLGRVSLGRQIPRNIARPVVELSVLGSASEQWRRTGSLQLVSKQKLAKLTKSVLCILYNYTIYYPYCCHSVTTIDHALTIMGRAAYI